MTSIVVRDINLYGSGGHLRMSKGSVYVYILPCLVPESLWVSALRDAQDNWLTTVISHEYYKRFSVKERQRKIIKVKYGYGRT